MAADHLSPAGDDQRDERIGAILNDFVDRRSRGEPVSEAELLTRHPDLAADLREHLELLRDLRPTADRIEALLRQGTLTPSEDPQYRAELASYRIIDFIGRGGMGLVLKAHDASLNRTVALKILRPELAEEPAALARFVREAKAAATLQHPNIVSIYGVGHERDVHFITMEYVEGTSLAELLRSGTKLTTELMRRIFGELLCGLEAAHAVGLIHRDIKSSNLLLTTPDRHVKIADFGLARMRYAQTQLTLGAGVLGTPEYMSPEQARGDETIDQRSDLYSAGVVLYEMLTGRTPFQADTATATLHRIVTQEPPPPSNLTAGVDRHLASLATRLMSKRPADRFASATETRLALEAARPVRSPATLRRWLWRVTGSIAAVVLPIVAFWAIRALPPHAAPGAGGARSHQITAALVDEHNPTHLLVRFGHDAPATLLHAFAPDAESVVSPIPLDLTGDGQNIVVAGTGRSTEGHCVFAFDPNGTELWRLDLTSDAQWPDCGPPTKWVCRSLMAVNIDNEPGDELLAVAQDPFEYPSRLAIVDPRTGTVRTSFWHMGPLILQQVAPDFFAPGRPAILITGLNNKLDGFDTPLPSDPPPVTRYDYAGVAMILDPDDMDGLGPPYTDRMPTLHPALPYAYGFLDLPPHEAASYVPPGGGPRVFPAVDDLILLAGLHTGSHASGSRGPADVLILALRRRDKTHGPGTIELDHDLDITGVVVASGEPIATSIEYWRAYWVPIIQHRQVVARPGHATAADTTNETARLVDVWVSDDNDHRILARYAGIPQPVRFRDFDRPVHKVQMVNLDGQAQLAVVVGFLEPTEPDCLIAFDELHNELWRLNLSSPRRWPDCAPPTIWGCSCLAVANLDGQPGDELVAVAGDRHEYGTRISVIDPRTAEIRSTFWHLGRLELLHIAEDFFGPGRPALVAAGVNNKLDGFAQPQPGDTTPCAHHDLVPAVVILDPRHMDGVGPPATQRLPDLPPAPVHAYAYLDLPAFAPAQATPATHPSPPAIAGVFTFNWLSDAPLYADTGPNDRLLELRLDLKPPDGSARSCATLIVDRSLGLRHVILPLGAPPECTEEFWRRVWKVLVCPE